MIGARHPIVVV